MKLEEIEEKWKSLVKKDKYKQLEKRKTLS